MSNNLGRIRTKRKTGGERVTSERTDLGFDLLGYCQRSSSDLVSNATRGELAEYTEYMLARALGIDTGGVRDEWAAHQTSIFYRNPDILHLTNDNVMPY